MSFLIRYIIITLNYYYMKKTFLLGLFILALTTLMTSCNKSNSENNSSNNGSNNGSGSTSNIIIIGNDVYQINSAFYDDDDDIELTFTCNDLIFDIDLDNYDKIPTGTFEITHDGRHTAEVEMLFHDYEYDVIGALTISQSDDVFTITITGVAVEDYIQLPFSCTYEGRLVEMMK